MADKKDLDKLSSIFYDPKHAASYSSAQKLYKSLQSKGQTIPLKTIQHWLQSQDVHTLHRPLKRKFPRNRVIVYGKDSQWDADLMDMTQLAKYNKSFNYVLLCIDILSKFVWVVALKTKQSKEVLKAFQKIFSQGRKPSLIRTDQGKEFVSRMAETLFKTKGIHHFVTQNETKANMAERAIKTIKNRIFKYFTKAQTYKYIDVLQDIVYSFNRTFHRSIHMTPVEVNKDNEDEVWQRIYLPFKKPNSSKIHSKTTKPKSKYKFQVGDTVRVSHLKKAFDREYSTKWTTEMFKIRARQLREGIPTYKLADLEKENVQGSFYEAELQKLHVTPNTEYNIEEILETRKIKRKTQYLVKWLFWPAKFNSWINASDIKNYKS